MAKDVSGKTMERVRVVDVGVYVDNENGIYVGARVTRELHSAIMAEKGRRQDRANLGDLVAEALVEKFINH